MKMSLPLKRRYWKRWGILACFVACGICVALMMGLYARWSSAGKLAELSGLSEEQVKAKLGEPDKVTTSIIDPLWGDPRVHTLWHYLDKTPSLDISLEPFSFRLYKKSFVVGFDTNGIVWAAFRREGAP